MNIPGSICFQKFQKLIDMFYQVLRIFNRLFYCGGLGFNRIEFSLNVIMDSARDRLYVENTCARFLRFKLNFLKRFRKVFNRLCVSPKNKWCFIKLEMNTYQRKQTRIALCYANKHVQLRKYIEPSQNLSGG